MRLKRWGWCALLCAEWAFAQAPAPLQDPGQHSVRIVRTTAAPPSSTASSTRRRGRTAALVDNLHQTSPIEYAIPDERTEIYLMYDDEALYIGARLYDPEPDKITANNLRQADNVGQDDRFYVTLDPFLSRTRGYFFGLNPNGVRADGLYQNVTDFYGAWDSIFYGAAGRFDGGWIAEFAIPFKSISFDPNTDTWGLNFSRGVVRKNENIAWVSRNRAYNPAVSGLMTGFEALDPRGLDVVTSASLRETRIAGGGTSSDFEPSLDLVYKITPELNGSLTFNTDFSATEVDDRQVNLTRFGLFFPEKRDFFLREADIFEFGRIGAQQDNISVGQPSRENGRPFFSRRIGLSGTGQIVDLDYGAKVSGRVGEWDIGALSIRQDEFEFDTRDPLTGVVTRVRLGPETLSAARARTRVLGESTFGFIATSGDPRGDLDNSLARRGLPISQHAPAGRPLARGRSLVPAERHGGARRRRRRVRRRPAVPSSNRFRGGVAFKQLEANYNPALGFVDRVGVDVASFDVGYTHRPPRGSYVQSLFISMDGERVEQIGGRLQTQTMTLRPFLLTNRTGDTLMMVYRDQWDNLPADFAISPQIPPIPRGDYRFDDLGMRFQAEQSPQGRRHADVRDGDFYGGTRVNINGDLHVAADVALPHLGRLQLQRDRAAARQLRDAPRAARLRRRVLVDAVAREPRAVRQRLAHGRHQRASALDSRARPRDLLRREPRARPRARAQSRRPRVPHAADGCDGQDELHLQVLARNSRLRFSAGLMTGLAGLDQGIGLDVVPSASLTNRRVLRNDNPAHARRRARARHVRRRLRAVARSVLQADAADERRVDVQHGLFGDRGRRPASQPDALRFVLPGEARLLPARGRHLRVRPHRRVGRHRRAVATPSGRTRGRSSRGASASANSASPSI